MELNNKKLGNKFEQEFCNLLSKNGYWAHFIEPNKSGGQPFDVIAGKNGKIFAYDCKTNKGNRFRLSRIEDNQELSFNKYINCGNNNCYFAIKKEEDNNIYIIPAMHLINLKNQNVKSVELIDEYLCWK